ncbi:carboxymuconolactone decarboxylase family protein [Actinomadura parmotrematis]|uniref:Carboxymuconolactone decarboxylase family protein n=1 Tax=Actinomadura parmotrematis TaxID=2864039 RepID=A0ABS7FQK0_9ACTN|nr:carboxymuconolactone decarboxylase family protein [Actinomadura parmotrematis]MBW8482641.1 carboxymuconolactone decarboxylase family protein [Actinomadura parmotrematis]
MRLPPLPDDQWDDRARAALAALLPEGRRDAASAGNALATLVRHPDLTRAFLPFNAHLLMGTTLPSRLRELAILRVAHRRACAYEWAHHSRYAPKTGLTDAEIAAAGSGPRSHAGNGTGSDARSDAGGDAGNGIGSDAGGHSGSGTVVDGGSGGSGDGDGGEAVALPGLEGAVLRAVDELDGGAALSDRTWAELSAELSERQLMDLVFTIGAYGLLAMAFTTFGVEPENER